MRTSPDKQFVRRTSFVEVCYVSPIRLADADFRFANGSAHIFRFPDNFHLFAERARTTNPFAEYFLNNVSLFFNSTFARADIAGLVRVWRRSCVHLVQVWYKSGAGLVRVWCRLGVHLVQVWCTSGARPVQVWSRSVADLVQVWCRFGVRLVRVWLRSSRMSGAGLVQVWRRSSRFGAGSVHVWCTYGATLVQVWCKSVAGLVQVWRRSGAGLV